MQPLSERDGSCARIYDLERAELITVPDELRYHAAAALDTGNLDGDLIAWLAAEDVLTYDSPPEGGVGEWDAGSESDETLDAPLDSLDRVFFCDDEIHCRLVGLNALTAMRTVRSVLHRADVDSRVVFHLSTPAEGGFPEALMPLVIFLRDHDLTAGSLVPTMARAVDLELLTDGRGLGRDEVSFLASSGFLVRLTEPHIGAMNHLLDLMPDRLVMSIRLDTGDRLSELWSEARALGAARVDAVKITDKPFDGLHRHEAELRRFRRDLFAICDDMFQALEQGERPSLIYEPIAQVVGRQLSIHARASSLGYLGLISGGELVAVSQDGLGGPARTADRRHDPCRSCWARELCVRGRWAGPAPDPHRPEPRADRCEFWRAEVEAGLLFYERLRAADVRHLAGFVQGRRELVLDPLAPTHAGHLPTF